jgi:hypothetical protein
MLRDVLFDVVGQSIIDYESAITRLGSSNSAANCNKPVGECEGSSALTELDKLRCWRIEIYQKLLEEKLPTGIAETASNALGRST